MIQSMTGFGKAVVTLEAKKITIELKSLNSKNTDLYMRLPQEYRERELPLRKMISEALGRGKIDCGLHVENNSGATSTQLNNAVIQHYIGDLKKISATDMHDDIDFLKMAVTLPDALTSKQEEIGDDEFLAVEAGLKEALDQLIQYRTDEGSALEKDFKLRLKNLTTLLEEVDEIDSQRIDKKRNHLRKAVADLKEEADPNRFEQELIYYIEKFDITEEKTRLANHLSYFETCLDSKDSNGKKLKFITQEMGREINTIGSKSNDAPLQKLVVQMKDELEKIKEQVLNVC